jgi:hypothetical protein
MAMAKEHGCSVKDIYERSDNGRSSSVGFQAAYAGAAPRLRHLRMVSVGQNTRGLERTGDL